MIAHRFSQCLYREDTEPQYVKTAVPCKHNFQQSQPVWWLHFIVITLFLACISSCWCSYTKICSMKGSSSCINCIDKLCFLDEISAMCMKVMFFVFPLIILVSVFCSHLQYDTSSFSSPTATDWTMTLSRHKSHCLSMHFMFLSASCSSSVTAVSATLLRGCGVRRHELYLDATWVAQRRSWRRQRRHCWCEPASSPWPSSIPAVVPGTRVAHRWQWCRRGVVVRSSWRPTSSSSWPSSPPVAR